MNKKNVATRSVAVALEGVIVSPYQGWHGSHPIGKCTKRWVRKIQVSGQSTDWLWGGLFPTGTGALCGWVRYATIFKIVFKRFQSVAEPDRGGRYAAPGRLNADQLEQELDRTRGTTHGR